MFNLFVAMLLVLAQSTQVDPLLARFEGQWAGEGTVLKLPSKVRLTWEWTLDRQFLRLTFVNQMPTRRFEGHAYYRATGKGGYQGVWLDNAGMIRPIEATRNADAMVAKWGTPETEVGETTYRLLPDATMEIVDRVQSKDGSWRDFGRVVATRQP